jgi:hypothetical protein
VGALIGQGRKTGHAAILLERVMIVNYHERGTMMDRHTVLNVVRGGIRETVQRHANVCVRAISIDETNFETLT